MATKQMPWQLNKCHIKRDQPIKYDQMSFGLHPKESSCDAWLLIFPVIKKRYITIHPHTNVYIYIHGKPLIMAEQKYMDESRETPLLKIDDVWESPEFLNSI